MLDWDAVEAHAAARSGAGRTTYYGAAAVSANGRPIVGLGREENSFVLHLDLGTKAMLIETDPDTYWETPHYAGWPALLVRYDSADPARVMAMIERAHAWALLRRPPRRKRE